MTATPTPPASEDAPDARPSAVLIALNAVGKPVNQTLNFLGGVTMVAAETLQWYGATLTQRKVRFGRPAFYSQIIRLGVRSVTVVSLVSGCVGLILALQMAPPLQNFGQVELVPNIIAVAVFRELGPLIAAVVLTGFAGASIAAELGTMVVGEEIEALEAHALNPIRFLVMPRVFATTLCTIVICIISELVAIGAGWWMGVAVLDIPTWVYYYNTVEQLSLADFLTGVWKAGVFGAIISCIACYNGLCVTGGAAGVGRATTHTVVFSIEMIIFSDLMFTAIFFRLGWT